MRTHPAKRKKPYLRDPQRKGGGEDRTSNIRATREAFTTQVEAWIGPVDRAVQTWHARQENDFK